MSKKSQSELKIITIGKPSIEAMYKAEQDIFFNALLDEILKLKAENDKKKASENESGADS